MAMGDINITVVGNLTADPELRFTPSGQAVANFTVASTARMMDRATNEWKDGDTVFLRCSVWRQYAENVAESLTKGTRVIVTGRLKVRQYETREGTKGTSVECDVEEVGPALKNATAKVNRIARSDGGFGGGYGGGQGGQGGQGGSYGGQNPGSGGQGTGQSGYGPRNDDPWNSQSGFGGAADDAPPF
ncbi:MAG: single-stranded DNA-binding protein [Candidatus Nanopelagicales bacterium]